MPSLARRAMSSTDTASPSRANISSAVARMRSRLRTASARLTSGGGTPYRLPEEVLRFNMPTIFDQFEACSVRRDGNAFAELFTEDAVMEFPFAKQRFARREALRARAVTARSASPVIVGGFADRIISEHGDDVCVEYTARVAVEGRTHDVRIVLRLRLHEGRIAL